VTSQSSNASPVTILTSISLITILPHQHNNDTTVYDRVMSTCARKSNGQPA